MPVIILRVGQRVRLKRDVERFSDFIALKGARGTINELTDFGYSVKMDEPIEGAQYWDNCVLWYGEERRKEFLDDVEVHE
jgi:hypothetical protein